MIARMLGTLMTIVALGSASCVTLLPKSDAVTTRAARDECEAISASFGAWSLVAAIAGGSALTAGVTNAILTDDTSEIVLGLVSLTSGVAASVAGALSGNAARTYVDNCTLNHAGAEAP